MFIGYPCPVPESLSVMAAIMWHKRKQTLTMLPRKGASVLAFFAGISVPSLAFAASIITTIVTNPLTGVAMDGYDPVSFFLSGEPAAGVPDFEYEWGGVPWYFENGGNRDAFARNPEIYAPQWGGHCPTSLARGYLSDGKPQIWLVEGPRLYLFYSEANRDAYLQSRAATLRAAIDNWKKLSPALAGPRTGTEPAPEPDPQPEAKPDDAAGHQSDAAH